MKLFFRSCSFFFLTCTVTTILWYGTDCNAQKAKLFSTRFLLLWQILEELFIGKKYMHILFIRCINRNGESTHHIQHHDFLFSFFVILLPFTIEISNCDVLYTDSGGRQTALGQWCIT